MKALDHKQMGAVLLIALLMLLLLNILVAASISSGNINMQVILIQQRLLEVQQAADSVNQWSALLQGVHTTNGENNVGGLLNARGCIEFDSASSRYIVTVVWQGLTEASATDSSCGEGNYGGASNRLRRLVSGTFYAPDLKG